MIITYTTQPYCFLVSNRRGFEGSEAPPLKGSRGVKHHCQVGYVKWAEAVVGSISLTG